MTNSPLNERGIEAALLVSTAWPELDWNDLTAVLCLAAAHAVARFTDPTDLGKDLPCSGFALANDFVATALNAAHWASPNIALHRSSIAEIEQAIEEFSYEKEEGHE